MQQEYRVVASRVDVYGPNEANKKPGVKSSLVLISADGTKGSIDDPTEQLATDVEQALANDREVVFYMKGDNSGVAVLTVGGTSYSY